MDKLPSKMPRWYGIDENENNRECVGWTPKTSDINCPEVKNAWTSHVRTSKPSRDTVQTSKLQVLSPIQVGGGSFPEGGILPAQIGGSPCVPGSSLRGAFLHWMRSQFLNCSVEEKEFWRSLMADDGSGWKPRQIRFETIWLKNLRPFPLHPQQGWQVFNQKSNKLGIQWQVPSPDKPGINGDRFRAQVLLKSPVTSQQQNWIKSRLEKMLEQQGIGRGTASGFGRLGEFIPEGHWKIRLSGMKPSVQSNSPNKKYRWSPQVLRACLRGYFTRLALGLMSLKDAKYLTDCIFGSCKTPASLYLTSFLKRKERGIFGESYVNIPRVVVTSDWLLKVNCNDECKELIDRLLCLASRLGGLGPGWRRPPHELKSSRVFRGSAFTVAPERSESLQELIEMLQQMIRELAQQYLEQPVDPPTEHISGGLISIWQGEKEQWRDIVHQVCATKNLEKPDWCGRFLVDKERPSGYSVREHETFCYITVFDPEVEAELNRRGYQRVWCT